MTNYSSTHSKLIYILIQQRQKVLNSEKQKMSVEFSISHNASLGEIIQKTSNLAQGFSNGFFSVIAFVFGGILNLSSATSNYSMSPCCFRKNWWGCIRIFWHIWD